jgi:hypothetical protein
MIKGIYEATLLLIRHQQLLMQGSNQLQQDARSFILSGNAPTIGTDHGQ